MFQDNAAVFGRKWHTLDLHNYYLETYWNIAVEGDEEEEEEQEQDEI